MRFQKKNTQLCNIVTTRAQAAVDIKRKCYWSFQIKSLPCTRPFTISIIEFAVFLLLLESSGLLRICGNFYEKCSIDARRS